MCEPTTIALASFAITAGSAALQHKAQNDAASSNEDAANKSYAATLRDIGSRSIEEKKSAAGVIDQAGIQTDEAVGTGTASAAQAGVAGTSVDLLLQNLRRQKLVHKTSVEENLESAQSQLQRGREGAEANRDARVASVPPANPWLTGLQIGSAALDFGAGHLARKPKVGS